MKRHGRTTPISMENYSRKEMSKVNRLQVDDKLDEVIECFALLNKYEHLNNLEQKENI